MKKILILSANPKNTNQLRLDEEIREIQAALRRSNNREKFEIVTEWALRVNDLRRALLDHQPHIVHFSGHGSGSDGLVLENNLGQIQLVSSESLAELFKLFKQQIKCVLLNACYSEVQAEAIYQHIDCVIGMNQAIGDVAAIEFTRGFYDALTAGRNYQDSFDFGCGAIKLQGIPESKTPQIKIRQNSQELKPETVEKQKLPVESSSIAEQPKYSGGISQSNVGSMGGGQQVSIGNHNQQMMTIQTSTSAEKQLSVQDVLQLLAQLEFQIKESEIPAEIKEEATTYLSAAKKAIDKDEPNKERAKINLEGVAEQLEKASKIAEAATTLFIKVKPILLKVINWLRNVD